MIVFDLKCDAGHVFEGWFNNSETYEKQVAVGAISCSHCGSTVVAKAPMAPNIAVKTEAAAPARDREMLANHEMIQQQFHKMAEHVRSHVEANFDYVGTEFPEEARKIHYGESKARPIYGEASSSETKELRDEGVDVVPLPFSPKADA